MATRLLSLVIRQRTWYLPKQLNLLQTNSIVLSKKIQNQESSSRKLQPNRLLHYKVYDKDARLDQQRESTRRKEFEERESNKEDGFKLDESELFEHTKRNRSYRSYKENPQKRTQVQTLGDELNAGDNADIFGNAKLEEEPIDEGDLAEEQHIHVRRPTREVKKAQTREYAHLIKEHLNAKRVKEAIDVLEQKMLKEDRVKPENYIYNLLISGCAKAGYTRKSFSLYNNMRKRGLKVTGGTYTSLFNACANAPLQTDGLGRANYLRQTMLEKDFEPNVKTYNVMIKAFGRCGDVKTAYLLVDEMLEKKVPLNTDTINFLLQACASDAEYGFRHCLLTWHKMLKCGLKPDYYTFNTVLRCVRDCGFGDLKTMQQVLEQIIQERKTFSISSDQKLEIASPSIPKIADNQQTEIAEITSIDSDPQLETGKPNVSLTKDNTQAVINVDNAQKNNPFSVGSSITTQGALLSIEEPLLNVPNLLANRPHLGSLLSLTEVNKPHERLLLLGGFTSFLELMKKNNITPDIQTFTTMLEVIPPTNSAEKLLLTFIRKIGLKADIDFFNILIKKRSMRFDYEGAKEVLSMIRTAGLHPDIVTYGVLALGCTTEEEAKELIQQMEQKEIRMNIQILGAMLRQGCAQKSFAYVTSIMQISLDENIKPNPAFITHLHNFYDRCARAIDARHPYTKSKHFKKNHAKFCDKLRLYYEECGIANLKLEDAIKKIKERPYEHYKEKSVEGIEPLKNETLARKQKIRKYIKKIKIANLRGDAKNLT